MKIRRTPPAPGDHRHRRRAPAAQPRLPLDGPSRRRQLGFSMIETLIAAALIGIIAIGIIPLFTRAMVDNMAGADYTRVTNYAKSKEEDFHRIPFSQPTIQVQAGQDKLLTTEFMDPATLQWVQDPLLPKNNPLAVWTRTTTYTQYNVFNTDVSKLFDNPIVGGSVGLDAIHVIQAQVQVKSVSTIGPLGGRRTTLVRYLKVF